MKLLHFLLLLAIIVSACHPEEEINRDQDAKLAFSSEQIFFDTIFTQVGSVTKRLKVYNRNSQAVTISSIELAGKTNSPYKIIINGMESYYQNNLTIRGGDSIYVLVQVTIDPQNQSLPFIVKDSILFSTNGNSQKVNLISYGQSATFLEGAATGCDTVWTNIKPFVIADFLRVPSGCTLTLKKGVRLYFRDHAFMDVKGTLLVEGEKDSLVTFTGDDLSETAKNIPGQWEGIIFDVSSKKNSINHAVIKNALTGIRILNDPADADTIPEVTISHSVIKNMQGDGVEANGADVYAYNSLFYNCVRRTFAGLGGGNYNFRHCTFANYSHTFFREGDALELSNYSGVLKGPLKARLTNCIVWGDRSNELQLLDNGSAGFDFGAVKSILRTSRTDQNINGNFINTDPQFQSPVLGDFHLRTTSPAINAALPIGIADDLEGKARDTSPDIGAYEK